MIVNELELRFKFIDQLMNKVNRFFGQFTIISFAVHRCVLVTIAHAKEKSKR